MTTELGLATDLVIAALTGEVRLSGDHRVVVTPSNPTFYSGNALVIPAAILAEPEAWEPSFVVELPGAPHRMVLVDGEVTDAALAPWLAAGFVATTSDVMVANAMIGPPPRDALVLGALDDWDAAREITLASDAVEGHADAGHVGFVRARLAGQRALVERGAARWYGARLDGALVATLGIVATELGARFQDVITHPDARRRGVASALVAHAGRAALADGATRLIIVVDSESTAQRVYARVGFATVGTTTNLSRT